MYEEDWEEIMDEEENWSKIIEHPHVLTLAKALNKVYKDGYKGWAFLDRSSDGSTIGLWEDGKGNHIDCASYTNPELNEEVYDFILHELAKTKYQPYLSSLPFERKSGEPRYFRIKKG